MVFIETSGNPKCAKEQTIFGVARPVAEIL